MLRIVMPFVLVLACSVPSHAVESIDKMIDVDVSEDGSTADNNSDWAPGEDSEPPACTSMEKADDDCTITPETPVHEPATAPDECIDWYYDDFWGDLYGCG
jgi:hypothetical protein